MAKRTVLLASASGLLVGIAIGSAFSWLGAAGAAPRGPAGNEDAAADAAASAFAQLAQLREEHSALEEAYQEVRSAQETERQRTALRAELQQTPLGEASTEPQPGEAAGAGTDADREGTAPTVSFGVWANEPALRTADWVDMGVRARDVVMARSAGIGGRQPAEMGALEKKAIRELAGHLDRIEAERNELGGHPVVVVNLMASHLEEAGRPLRPWQIEAIDARGREYEAQAERMRIELASGDALATERKLRSILLRKAVVDQIVTDVLTPEQWRVLFHAETKGLLYYDVYQVGGLELERPNSSVYWRNVRADGVEHLKLFLLTEWEVSRDDLERLDGLVEQWIDSIMAQPKFAGHPTSALHIEEVLPCVEVHVQFQKRVIEALANDPERVQIIRENTVYAVFPSLRS